MQDKKQQQITLEVSFSEDELEEILTALNYYDVKYYMQKEEEDKHDEFSRKYWHDLSSKCTDLFCKMFDIQKELRNKQA